MDGRCAHWHAKCHNGEEKDALTHKSLALKLHSDALTENERETSKVRILPYDGVAPARYLELFDISFGSRKNGCDVAQRARRDARPKCEVTLESIPALEGLVVKRLSAQKVLAT